MIRRSSVRTALVSAALVALAWSGQAQHNDFFEQKTAYFRDEVVEGASKHPETPAEAPATVTVLTSDDIRRYGFRTVADVLNFASLGSFTHDDRRYDFVGSRGLFFFEDFNTRILVLLNGHPLNEPWNNFGGVGREMLVPLELAERVEIVYGPSSLLYGGYSLYGLVNVVTHSGGSLGGTRVTLRAGGFDEREVIASHGREGVRGAKATRWSLLAAGGVYESNGEDLDLPLMDVGYPVDLEGGTVWGGPQSGTAFERSPFAFVYGRYGELTLMARSGSREHGAPFAPYETIYGSSETTVRDDKSFVDLMWEHPISGRTNVSVRAFYDWYAYQEIDPYADDTLYDGEPGYNFVLKADDSDRGVEARVSTRRGTHFLSAGAEYRQRRIYQRSYNECFCGARDDESILSDRVSGTLLVAYAQEEWRPSERWTFVAGGTFAETDPGGQKAQPRLAAIYKPRRDLAVKALYGTGFRPPSIFEAGYSDYTDQIGNPALESEEIRSAELSLTWEARPNVVTQLYAFRSQLEGLIGAIDIESVDQIEGGVVPPSGDVDDLIGTRQYQALADVESRGFGASARLARATSRAYLNIAYATAQFEGLDSSRLDASPSWLASAGAASDWRDFTGALYARYVGFDESSFAEANARVAWSTRIGTTGMTWFVEGRNLLDSDGAVPASSIYAVPEIPIEGRRFVLGVEARF